MENGTAASDQRLDDLYREHPEGFVAGRDRLAKELRDAGDRAGAERVKKLRRPTAAAWLINRAALSSPAQLEAFAEASRQLEAAQERALEGEGEDEGVAEWRAAAAREREATAAVVDLAESGGREAGHQASERALELVGETLRAATGDPELRERVLRGRVEREQSAATLGTPAVAPRRRESGPAKRRESASAKRRGVAQARRDLRRLQGELADATAGEERLGERVEQAREALREEKARLAETKRETAALRRQVKAAERRARS
jgi:hypothetical protein